MTIRKKSLALILGLSLVLGILSGCQSPGSGSGSQSMNPTAGDPGSTSGSGVNVTPGPSGSGTGSDIDLAAITDICMATIGVPSDTVMATVDGEEISAMEILYWVTSDLDNLSSYFYYYYGMTELPWDEDFGTTTPRQFVQEDALHGAALYHLVSRHAKAENLQVRQEDQAAIQTSIQTLTTQQADKGGVQLYMWLSLLDEELYTWYCECEYLYSVMTDKYYGEDSGNYPSDQAVLDFLEEEGWYSCKHILLATIDLSTRQPLDEATIAAKKTQAEGLLAQLRASDDPAALFDQLMNEYSEDTGLVTNPDGYLAEPGQMYAEFEEGAKALAEGEISDIVTTDVGYHIILRKPLDADPNEYRDDYIESMMTEMRDGWVDAADIQTTEAFDKLDIVAFYKALQDLRTAYETKYEVG